MDNPQEIKPKLAVIVTTWSHESGAAYARQLVDLFPPAAPLEIEVIACPRLLEAEGDIPAIAGFFAGKNLDAACIIPGNFTLDHIMPLMAEALKLPVVLWGLPTREAWGALVAVQQTVFAFKELGLPFRFVTGRLDDPQVWGSILPYLHACAIQNHLKGLRVGLMGWRAQGMSDVLYDELAMRSAFGVQLVNIGLTRYTRALEAVPQAEVEAAWQQIKIGFDTTQLPEKVAHYGVRSYLALKDFVAKENLKAISLECFHDHLGGPCLGFCMLNSQGIAAPCENDAPAAILMAAAQRLSCEPTFHTDIVEADYAQNRAVFHHCGNLPYRLASDESVPALKPIRETAGPGAYGPTVQAWMKTGWVTVANLVNGRSGLRLSSMEGQVLAEKVDLPGSGAKVSFSFSLKGALEQLGNLGYGHHFVLIRGRFNAELAEWSKLAGMQFTCIE